MWPNLGADTANWRIWKIMALPYWQMYGELFIDELKGNHTIYHQHRDGVAFIFIYFFKRTIPLKLFLKTHL